MKEKDIEEFFTYHPPVGDQAERYQEIREAAKVLAYTINKNCEDSADKSAAIRKLRECVMTANASIALEMPPTDEPPVERTAVADTASA